MRFVAHKPKASETRPPRPVQARPREREARAGDEARFLRRLDLELRFVDRRRRGGGGNRLVLRANDRFGRVSGAGAIVDRDARGRRGERRGGGAGAGAHARRSPIRNCSARSSRICGAGSPRWVERRAEADEPPVVVGLGQGDRVALEDRVRVGRQFAGKHRRFGDAVEDLAADRLALFRHADDGVERLAAGPDLSLAGGADRGERDDVDLGPDPFGARDRLCRQGAQDRLQPVMARMVQMVGLGRREQDAVDAGAEDRGEPRGASGAEGAHDVGERVLEIA